MSAHRGATPYQWTDADGTALPLLCRVKQIKTCPQAGATPSRLHQRGHVVGWDTTWLHVCFEPDHAFVVLRAHLVRAWARTATGDTKVGLTRVAREPSHRRTPC